jgi:cytochrome b
VSTQQTPGLDVNANDVVAFLVEMGVLILLASAGARVDGPTVLRVALAVVLPVVAALCWGLFAAPRARIRSVPLQLATKVLVLGAGVAAGYLVLPGAWAAGFMVVVLVNTALMYVGPFARPRVS